MCVCVCAVCVVCMQPFVLLDLLKLISHLVSVTVMISPGMLCMCEVSLCQASNYQDTSTIKVSSF